MAIGTASKFRLYIWDGTTAINLTTNNFSGNLFTLKFYEKIGEHPTFEFILVNVAVTNAFLVVNNKCIFTYGSGASMAIPFKGHIEKIERTMDNRVRVSGSYSLGDISTKRNAMKEIPGSGRKIAGTITAMMGTGEGSNYGELAGGA